MTWTLHHGDCLDPVAGLASLADKSVDVTITDPPYEAESHNKGRRIMNPRTKEIRESALTFAKITEAERIGLAREAIRVSRRWVLIFAQLEGVQKWRDAVEMAGGRYIRTMIWIKPNGQPQLTGDRPGVGYECIVVAHASKGRMRWNGGGKRGFIIMPTEANFSQVERVHETQKPIDLMLELVADFSDPGDLILDPFAGSGTTAIAALMLGRRFIGWERDDNYHAIATRRISGDEAKPREEQPSLFGAIGGAR